MLLQRQDAKLRGLVLGLIQRCTVEAADPVDGEPQCWLAWVVGYLVPAIESTQDQADARVRIDDAGDVGQAMELVGAVVNCVKAGCRVLNASIVLQKVTGDIPVDRTSTSAILEAWLQP